MTLADAITAFVRNEISRRIRRTGTVSGTSGTKVIVSVDGSLLTLPRLATYTPTVGDIVLIDAAGDGWVVLGKTA